MKKLLLAMGLALAFQATAQTYVIDTEACAGDEYIYDQAGELVMYDPAIHTFVTAQTPVFYASYETIPHSFLAGNRFTQIFVLNTSEENVNFFFRPTYYSLSDGSETSLQAIDDLTGIFSTTNDPSQNSGAAMTGKTVGRITFDHNQTAQYFSTISIYWDTSVCLSLPPMLTSVESNYNVTGNNARAGISVYNVNDGKNW